MSGQNIIPSNKKSAGIVQKTSNLLKDEMSKTKLVLGSQVYIRIFKKSKELEVQIKKEGTFNLLKIYHICTYGEGTLGPKLLEGDEQAPEGFYSVGSSTLNPESAFHLSIGVGYPNEFDRTEHRTGNAIVMHGDCVSIGCFAMTDSSIEEIYTLVYMAFRNGQQCLRIDIFPFRMTDENMKKFNGSEWMSFWLNLKQGYDLFEKNKTPPKFRVAQHKYDFTLK